MAERETEKLGHFFEIQQAILKVEQVEATFPGDLQTQIETIELLNKFQAHIDKYYSSYKPNH